MPTRATVSCEWITPPPSNLLSFLLAGLLACMFLLSLCLPADKQKHKHRIVYHIHQRDFRRITIPSNLMYLYAYGSTVGFTVFQLDDESLPEPTPREFRRRPYLWRWEENLLPVDLPPSDTTASRLTEDPNCVHDVGFIFHPWDPQVFFLVSMCAGPGKFCVLCVPMT